MGMERAGVTYASLMGMGPAAAVDTARLAESVGYTPFWVAETSNLGLDVARQSEWLDAYVARLAKMRADGLPVRGLCWYSRGDQFDWQTALIEPSGALTEVGLFTQDRVARPAAARFAGHVASGTPSKV